MNPHWQLPYLPHHLLPDERELARRREARLWQEDVAREARRRRRRHRARTLRRLALQRG